MSKPHPSDLRSRTIRLAHARPELRPHLLPLLREAGRKKEAWVPIPSDAFGFGYEGLGSDRAGRTLGQELRAALHDLRAQASRQWKALAKTLIENADFDVQPELSRVGVSEAFKYTYQELASAVDGYFEGVPVP